MREHEKPAIIPAATVMQVRRALGGGGVLEIKYFLEAATPLFYSRFIEATQTQVPEDGFHFHDPIEDDPEFETRVEAAHRDTEEALRDTKRRTGVCHLFWHTKQKILRENYGIEWFTPAEMNPWIRFD